MHFFSQVQLYTNLHVYSELKMKDEVPKSTEMNHSKDERLNMTQDLKALCLFLRVSFTEVMNFHIFHNKGLGLDQFSPCYI